MFYSVELLAAHRGKFSLIWLAATRMRKKLTRKELNSVNIVDACTEIASCICGRTRVRFSLYLASQLTFGLCIIYKEKIEFVLRDLQELFSRGKFVHESTCVDLPITLPSVKPTRSKKRRREQADLQEIPLADPFRDSTNFEFPDLVNVNDIDLDLFDTTQNSLHQARVEDITLTEENINLVSGCNLTFGDELSFPTNLDVLPSKDNITAVLVQSAAVETLSPQTQRRRPATVLDDLTESKAKVPRPVSNAPITEEHNVLLPDTSIFDLPNERRQLDQHDGEIQAMDPSLVNLLCDGLVEPPVLAGSSVALKEFESLSAIEAAQADQPQPMVHEASDVKLQHPEAPVVAQTSALPHSELHTRPRETFDIHLLPLEQEPAVQHGETRHRRANRSKLLIDDKIKLTSAEMRWNTEHGEETMLPLGARLTEPSSRTKTQYLLSRCVPRLFALPARVDTAIGTTVCELWCRHRRLAEQGCNDEELTVQLERLTDQAESSIEKPRAAQPNSSIRASASSLLGTTNILNMTVNQQNSVLDASTSVKGSAVLEEPTAPNPPLPPNPLNTTTDWQPQMYETTMLVPLPEEQEELMKLTVLELPGEQIEQPQMKEPPPAPTPLYTDSRGVWNRLQELLADSKDNVVQLEELCSTNTTKKDAALVFSTILHLAKRRLIRPSQAEPYGPIYLRHY